MKNEFWKRCIRKFFISAGLLLGTVAVINFTIDPMYLFWDRKDPLFEINVRQQKPNYIRFVKSDFDSFAIGSSHVMSIVGSDLNEENFFNYGVGGLHSKEYTINFDLLPKTNRLKVYFGLDFFGTNESVSNIGKFTPLGNRTDVFSISMLYYSILSKINASNQIEQVEKSVLQDLDWENIAKGRANLSFCAFSPNRNFREIISQIVKNYAQHKFIVFLTPEVTEFLKDVYITRNLLEDYLRWVRDTVEVFGEVWNFNYVNSVTRNHDYWSDSDHLNPKGARAMAQRISGGTDFPLDFGTLVARDNLDEHLEFLRKNILENLSQDVK